MRAAAYGFTVHANGTRDALGHAVERALGPDLVEAGVERLGRVEAADHAVPAWPGSLRLLVGLDGLSVPAHEHMFAQPRDRTDAPYAARHEQADLLAHQRLARRLADLDVDVLAGLREAGEVDDLVVARAAAQAARVGARRALDEHLQRAPDEPLRALAGAALDDLDQPLHALDLLLVRDGVLELGRLGAAARREDERERAVVADLLDDLERLAEVRLGLPGEADDDVGGQRDVRHVLADQRDAVQVALARVGAAHRLEDPRSSPPAAAGGCARRRTPARRARGSRPRACPSGAGSCSGSGARRRARRARRSSCAKLARSGRRSRP